jgi:hypothetical protein
MSDTLLTTRQVAELLGACVPKRCCGDGCRRDSGYQSASNCLRLRESEIEAWLETRLAV